MKTLYYCAGCGKEFSKEELLRMDTLLNGVHSLKCPYCLEDKFKITRVKS